ncbi:uncharacterized protein FRV6_11789 [Fusarium oxysporum]|uniref:Uncharacterized protein n=1 Tax=Fusarium oxysporum TaxID=5507 RepID=A0A2H3TG74_FUSOX|nr:uncharacterized protein FRV6_11789 [Fusarium oxysporum]
MASRPRVLPFSGDDDAYNHYLEQFFLTVKARYPSAFKETCCLIPAPSFLATNEEQENSSLQVCHYDPTPPPLTHGAPRVTQRATRLLERIPRTEKDWQIARHQLGFENEQQILSSLSKIRGCAWRFKQHELKDHSISALGEQATAFTQELSAFSEDEGNLHISLKRKRNETSPATSYQNIELDSPSSRPRPLDPSSTISSDRSPSYFPNSIISVDTNSTTVSDGHPLSPGQGPMLCYDTGIEEEARNITSLSLSKNALETGTLPSQDMDWDEPDDWIRGTEVELIGPNATEEFYAA